MKVIKYVCVAVVSISFLLVDASAGDIKGRLSFSQGKPAPGNVTVGIIRNQKYPFLSASFDGVANQLGVIASTDGSYWLRNVPEYQPLLVMVEILGQSGPSYNKSITLESGKSVENLNFMVAEYTATETKLKGCITVNGGCSRR